MKNNKIPQTVVEQVKEQIDLSALISTYIPLKRFKALCPFHSEKIPSFVIYPIKQGKDAFIRKVENILDDLEKEVRLGKYL
jgi:DNA primase